MLRQRSPMILLLRIRVPDRLEWVTEVTRAYPDRPKETCVKADKQACVEWRSCEWSGDRRSSQDGKTTRAEGVTAPTGPQSKSTPVTQARK